MKLALIFALSLIARGAFAYSQNDLVDFYTDGCTDAPDGSVTHPNEWLHCCYKHDKMYYAGGTADERQAADSWLAQCVQTASGNKSLATIYYYGVRMGGSPYRNTSYRWGYGWPYGRGYAPLSNEERGWVNEKFAAFSCLRELNAFTYDAVELHKACD